MSCRAEMATPCAAASPRSAALRISSKDCQVRRFVCINMAHCCSADCLPREVFPLLHWASDRTASRGPGPCVCCSKIESNPPFSSRHLGGPAGRCWNNLNHHSAKPCPNSIPLGLNPLPLWHRGTMPAPGACLATVDFSPALPREVFPLLHWAYFAISGYFSGCAIRSKSKSTSSSGQ